MNNLIDRIMRFAPKCIRRAYFIGKMGRDMSGLPWRAHTEIVDSIVFGLRDRKALNAD